MTITHSPNLTDLTDYFLDAATWGCTDLLAPTGDEFVIVRPSHVTDYPELAAVFGVQITPANRIVLHGTRDEYMNAISNAQSL